jgi:hypothetical protein
MPARDKYHDAVKNALIKDGWDITDDPLHLEWGPRDLYVDLGAEKLFAAEKEGRKIAVEVKSFAGASDMAHLEQALGQYVLYRSKLKRLEPERKLYLAMREAAFEKILTHPDADFLLSDEDVKLLIFSASTEEVKQWLE